MAAEFKKKPKLSVVKLTRARPHQVDQVEVVLQVGKDLDLAQQGRQLRSIEGIVDRLHGDLGDGARIIKSFGLADIHAAKVAAAQQLTDLKLGPVVRIQSIDVNQVLRIWMNIMINQIRISFKPNCIKLSISMNVK